MFKLKNIPANLIDTIAPEDAYIVASIGGGLVVSDTNQDTVFGFSSVSSIFNDPEFYVDEEAPEFLIFTDKSEAEKFAADMTCEAFDWEVMSADDWKQIEGTDVVSCLLAGE